MHPTPLRLSRRRLLFGWRCKRVFGLNCWMGGKSKRTDYQINPGDHGVHSGGGGEPDRIKDTQAVKEYGGAEKQRAWETGRAGQPPASTQIEVAIGEKGEKPRGPAINRRQKSPRQHKT